LNLKITYANKSKIVFKFIDDSEILEAEDEFANVQMSDSSSDEDYHRVWELRNSYEQRYYTKLLPLVEKLNEFYKDRETDYKHQIFLNSDYLFRLSISPNILVLDFFEKDADYLKKIYQEFKDFDNFL